MLVVIVQCLVYIVELNCDAGVEHVGVLVVAYKEHIAYQ